MVRTAVGLFSLRTIDAPLPDVIDLVGETPLDGVEFAGGVHDADTDAVADALDRNDLVAASAHVGLEALEDEYDETTEQYDRLDCDTLVVPWLDPEHFESEARVADAADRLDAVAAALASDGFDLQYHNHDHEFVPLGDGTAMDELLARTDDLGFEVDLGWARAGGVDPVAVVDEWADRISHVHFADIDTEAKANVRLGEGDLDVEACLDAVRRAGAEWYVYEHDDPDDPRESLAHGAERLESYR